MTNERAINLLHRLQDEQFDGIHGDERREALNMAVRALSSQQTDTDSQGLVNDCISRKMAIDAINNCYCGGEDSCGEPWIYEDDAIKAVEQLPSAQPTQTNADLTHENTLDCVSRQAAIDALGEEPEVWEDDDEYGMGQRSEWCHIKKIIEKLPSAQTVNYGSTKSDSSSQLKLNNDLISRQQAIDTLDGFRCGTKAAWKVIEDLPSAQPQCKKGKWIEKEHSPFYCSVCGTYQYSASWEIKNKEYNFCPRCGADMRGEHNG